MDSTMIYEVVVGNIGTVYSGGIHAVADGTFSEYVRQSKTGYGRAGGEDVTILRNGDIITEFIGSINQCLADSDEDA